MLRRGHDFTRVFAEATWGIYKENVIGTAAAYAYAGGNADVDIEMLECARFGLLINHDDAEREFAYAASAGASLVRAEELGRTVVNMKDD